MIFRVAFLCLTGIILPMSRRCVTCHTPIAPARLHALPTATTCVSCSTEQPMKGYMTWEHKTAPVFQVVTPQQHEWLQSRDRKGMRSGLPMSSRGTSVSPIAGNPRPVSAKSAIVYDTSSVPKARKCPHTDRPQASSAGKCLECAVSYYAIRAQCADKKMLQTRRNGV